jgi:hypothetical protein
MSAILDSNMFLCNLSLRLRLRTPSAAAGLTGFLALVLVVIEAALLQPVKSSPPALTWTRRGVVQRRAGPRHGQPWPRRTSHARSGAPAPACSASRRLSSIALTA